MSRYNPNHGLPEIRCRWQEIKVKKEKVMVRRFYLSGVPGFSHRGFKSIESLFRGYLWFVDQFDDMTPRRINSKRPKVPDDGPKDWDKFFL